MRTSRKVEEKQQIAQAAGGGGGCLCALAFLPARRLTLGFSGVGGRGGAVVQKVCRGREATRGRTSFGERQTP